jgi:hypothetical protein
VDVSLNNYSNRENCAYNEQPAILLYGYVSCWWFSWLLGNIAILAIPQWSNFLYDSNRESLWVQAILSHFVISYECKISAFQWISLQPSHLFWKFYNSRVQNNGQTGFLKRKHGAWTSPFNWNIVKKYWSCKVQWWQEILSVWIYTGVGTEPDMIYIF